MKKEAVIAIILGIFLGLGGATFLILKASPSASDKLKLPQLKETTSPVGSTTSVSPLEVMSPQKDLIINSNSITVKGKAQKGDLIVIQSPIKEVVLENKQNEFSTTFPLALGENVIVVTAYPKNSKIPPQERELKVYYLDEE